MVSSLDPGSSIFLANLSRIEQTNQQTQQQISSGLKITQPQDAPDEVSQLLTLQASLSRTTQVQTNLTAVQTVAVASDTAITTTLQLTDQAESLAASGVSSTVSAQTRQQLAQQVQAIFNQVFSLSQTSLGGRYIFGGDTDQAPSYKLDPTSPTGVTQLSAALNTSTVEDSNGGSFSTGLTAAQIFDARNPDGTTAPGNLFAALNSLALSLTNNDTAGITAALNSVQQASTFVNTQQGFYGGLQNRLTQSISSSTSLSLSLTNQISSIRDTNISEAAIELTQGSTQYQAALEAQSKVPHTSLFDYLS